MKNRVITGSATKKVRLLSLLLVVSLSIWSFLIPMGNIYPLSSIDMSSEPQNMRFPINIESNEISEKSMKKSTPIPSVQDVGDWIAFIMDAEPGTNLEVLPKSRDTVGLCIDSNFFGMYKKPVTIDTIEYHQLLLPGAGYLFDVGKPAIPRVTRYFEVPYDINISLEVIYAEAQILDGYNVFPIQEPIPTLPNTTSPPFTKDNIIYQTDAFYPGYNASQAGGESHSSIILRGHRILELSLYPVQFNPKTQQVKIYSKMEVTLKYDTPAQIRGIEPRLISSSFEGLYQAFISNYKYRKYLEKSIYEISKGSSATSTSGAEYLIITNDTFYPEVQRLARWKMKKGVLTKVVKTSEIKSTGPSADDIKDYIQTAYDTWSPVPSYLLLVGDSEHIPPYYGMEHPAYDEIDCDWNPATPDDTGLYHGGGHVATDIFYCTVDGADYFPDIFHGRISVDTLAEAQIIVDKILTYERNPPLDANFYGNVSSISHFEDGDLDNQEDYEFVTLAEDIRDFLENIGYTVDRHYTAPVGSVPATDANGNALPAGIAWTGSAVTITNAFDAGSILAYYIDHGQSRNFWNHICANWGGMDGWAHPRFTTGNLPWLNNMDLQAFVLSMACNCGWFDGEVDQLDDNTLTQNFECFSEEITRLQNAGAIASVGSTRISFVSNNARITRGMVDAIWPGYDLNFDSGGLYHLGQILMYGKAYVATNWGYNSWLTNITYHLYHLFGDPEMSLWINPPEDLAVTYPNEIGSNGQQSFVITVSDADTGRPVNFARVCLQKGTEVYEVEYTNPAGYAYLRTSPTSSGKMNITVTHQNATHAYRPHEGEITVTDIGATISVQPTYGPSGITIIVDGSAFGANELVEITFGGTLLTPNAGTDANGIFSESYIVPSNGEGPVNIIATGITSGRTAVKHFRRLPDELLPDPYIYSQWDESTWHLANGELRWDNPCIKLYDSMGQLTSSGNLRLMEEYTIRATFYNDAPGSATNAQVWFEWADYGAGGTFNLIDDSTQLITIPGDGGTAVAQCQWTFPVTGHCCVVAEVHHDWDESFTNNRGQENLYVHPVHSPGETNFTITNPTDTPALVYLEATQADHIEDIWPAHLSRDSPQTLEPGNNQIVLFVVTAPDDANINETRRFTISAFINDELIGGVEIEVVKGVLSPPIISYPNGGEEFACENVTVRWTAAEDSLGHSISYTVYYSPDGGTKWTELVSGLTTTSYLWQIATIEDLPGENYLIKVVATCSAGEDAEDVSDNPFAVQCGVTTTTTTTTTTKPALGWAILISLISLSAMLPVKQRKKKS